MVEVSDLRKAYRGGFEDLRGIDFEIRRGETFALLKTHLLHAFAKLEVRDRTRAVTRAMELGLL